MKKYFLKTKEGEVINTKESYTKEEAITFFSNIKKLNKKDLLKIYVVKSD